MSSEILREAAAKLRGRAKAAEGEWFGAEGWYAHHELHSALKLTDSATDADADAEYIASMHPAVALAVADWLETVSSDTYLGSLTRSYGEVVARTYLGRTDA